VISGRPVNAHEDACVEQDRLISVQARPTRITLQEIDPMTKTVTSLFHSGRHAETAASRLVQAGIPRDGIDIWSVPINLAPVLEDAGVSRSDTQAYVEGVLHGGSVVIVSCADGEVERVVRILDDEGALDLDEWRASAPPETDHGMVRIQSREEDRPA
jgi:hypothetical protein